MSNTNYNDLIQAGDSEDLGLCIQNLIQDNLKALNTCFIAKIVNIKGNKVSITQAIKSDTKEANVIINDCLVAFPYSSTFQTQFRLNVGDFGIALVNNKDLSTFKQAGRDCIVSNKRYKNINDSIFLPLSLYKTLSNDKDYLLISNSGDVLSFDKGAFNLNATNTINVKANSDVAINANATNITSATIALNGNTTIKGDIILSGKSQIGQGTTLNALLSELGTLLTSLASAGNAGQKAIAPQFSAWASKLSQVFKG